jgi:hypothetical protein
LDPNDNTAKNNVAVFRNARFAHRRRPVLQLMCADHPRRLFKKN